MTHNTEKKEGWEIKFDKNWDGGTDGLFEFAPAGTDEVKNKIKDFIRTEKAKSKEEGKVEMWREVGGKILPVAEKFIKKVQTGRAKSKETYADMLTVKEMFKNLEVSTSHHDNEYH